MIVPPLPRASAVVDPRIGDLGPALLALEDGTVFPGVAFGAAVESGGDLVVNTSQTGYQEVCTDPSYAGQIVVMTYPLIGNYGRLAADDQSLRPWLRALVVANATAAVLDDARQLAALLRDAAIPAIAGVDTRALARHLRTSGSLRAIVTAPGDVDHEATVVAGSRRDALGGPGLRAARLAARDHRLPGRDRTTRPRIGIVDLGLKTNIVRAMRHRGAAVRVFPHTVVRDGRPVGRHRRRDPVARPRRPGPPRGAGRRWRGRSSMTAGRCWASAWATRSSDGPPARTPAGCGSGTTGRTTRSRTWSSGSSR